MVKGELLIGECGSGEPFFLACFPLLAPCFQSEAQRSLAFKYAVFRAKNEGEEEENT